MYNKDSNAGVQSIAVHPILNNPGEMNKNNPVSYSYIKEESFMAFFHGKLRHSVKISMVITAEQFTYIFKLIWVKLGQQSLQ